MTRNQVAAVLLALATTAGAADATTAKPNAKGPPSKVTAVQAKDVRIAKARFMSAVASCSRPEVCDPKAAGRDPELTAFLERAEETFMVACLQCAAQSACEEERVRIRDGRGRFASNLCMQGEPGAPQKPADSKKTSK